MTRKKIEEVNQQKLICQGRFLLVQPYSHYINAKLYLKRFKITYCDVCSIMSVRRRPHFLICVFHLSNARLYIHDTYLGKHWWMLTILLLGVLKHQKFGPTCLTLLNESRGGYSECQVVMGVTSDWKFLSKIQGCKSEFRKLRLPLVSQKTIGIKALLCGARGMTNQ